LIVSCDAFALAGNNSAVSVAPPADVRGAAGLVGLTNLGNTCYMNACLQLLYMQPAVRAGILALPIDSTAAAATAAADSSSTSSDKVQEGAVSGESLGVSDAMSSLTLQEPSSCDTTAVTSDTTAGATASATAGATAVAAEAEESDGDDDMPALEHVASTSSPSTTAESTALVESE
jgi:Ubiquitin carboxyl-terminal hydrolase